MRALLCAVSAATLLALPHSIRAQTWSPSVNQRMTPPTSQADSYMSVSLGQLVMALGLTLQGIPPQGLDDIRLLYPRPRQAQTAAVPASLATPTETTAVPAAVQQPDKAP